MKKQVFAMMTLSALVLTACGDAYTVQDTPAAGLAEQGDSAPMMEGNEIYNETYLWTEQDCYLPDTEVIRVTISNNTEDELGLGAEQFMLYRIWENGHSEALPYKQGGDAFNELALLVMPHDSATFVANLAAHYDLPLEEGDYLIEIGGMQTGFTVSADAQAVIPAESLISIQTELDTYPADTTDIKVQITNDSDELYTYYADSFGLEKFGDGFVSMTPYAGVLECCQPQYGTVRPHSTGEWMIHFRDYGESPLSPGDYAVCFAGKEARFTITGETSEQDTADAAALPDVMFYVLSQYPQTEADAPASRVTFLTKDGTVFSGEADLTIDEIAALYETGTLSEHYAQRKCFVDADEAAAQYRKLCRAAESNPNIIYPDAEPAVEDIRTFWYTYIRQEDGTWRYCSMGEDFCGAHYPSESKNINQVYEWVSEQLNR